MSARARPGRVFIGKTSDYKRKYMQARCAEMRSKINSRKTAPCMYCGKCFPSYVMDFDHVRGEKKYHIGSLASSSKSWETISAEIDKCDLVCANCHRVRTYGRGFQVTSKRVAEDTIRTKQIPKCHPEKRHAARGLCVMCYKREKRGIKFCIVCGAALPKYRAKLCSDTCRHTDRMEKQKVRRALMRMRL